MPPDIYHSTLACLSHTFTHTTQPCTLFIRVVRVQQRWSVLRPTGQTAASITRVGAGAQPRRVDHAVDVQRAYRTSEPWPAMGIVETSNSYLPTCCACCYIAPYYSTIHHANHHTFVKTKKSLARDLTEVTKRTEPTTTITKFLICAMQSDFLAM